MSETWGLMPKSQIDPTTIETRITEMVAEHNDDPDAHLGGGRSIEVHKTNEVLDHPAGSVPIDKFAFSRSIKTWFETIDGWVDYASGTGSSIAGLGALFLYTGTTTGGVGAIVANGSGFTGLNMSKAFYWRSTAVIGTRTGITAYWGPAYVVDQSDFNGFGFRVLSGDLQAFMGDFTNLETVTIPDIDLTETHIFEIRYIVDPQTVEFYIDGNLVATFDDGNFPENGDEMCSLYVKSTENVAHAISVSDFQYEQER